MEADLHMTLSPVTDLSVTADSVATECALSPKAKLSLFDETCFLPEQILLLHKKPCSRLQGTSFHPFQLSTRCMQVPARPSFGSPRAQNVAFQGLQSIHFQVSFPSMLLPPSHAWWPYWLSRPVLFFIPSRTKSKVAVERTDAKWPPSLWQKSSAEVQFFLSVLHR